MNLPCFSLFQPVIVRRSLRSSTLATPSFLIGSRRSIGKCERRSNVVQALAEEVIPEKLVWIDAVPVAEVQPATLTARVLGGLEICIACGTDGQVYALGNKGTPLGVPLSSGRIVEVEGQSYLQCPQYGTLFDLGSGDVKDKSSWIVSPPVISNILRFLFPEPAGVQSYSVREDKGMFQVCVNVNARAQYEQQYWKGLLDARGKADGGYY